MKNYINSINKFLNEAKEQFGLYWVIATEKDGVYQRFQKSKNPKKLLISTKEIDIRNKFNYDIVKDIANNDEIILLILSKSDMAIEEKYFKNGKLVQHDKF